VAGWLGLGGWLEGWLRGWLAAWWVAISAEHVSCTAPPTENASLQIIFKCPTPANAFATATKPSCFAHS